MTKKLRIVLAQLNLTVGDLNGNLEKHLQAANKARDELGADIIVFPELSLTGYPPEDLLLRQSFLDAAHHALQTFVNEVRDIHCIVSHPHATSQGLYNACSVIYNGNILGQYSKQHLPNYGVFDEYRYFKSGNTPCVVPIHDVPVGIVICEDLWKPGPTRQAKDQGAQIIISPNASPFELDKHEQRVAVLAKLSKQHHIPIVYVNMVGGQDEITFDGGSMVFNEDGILSQFAGFFNETLMPADIPLQCGEVQVKPNATERIYQSLVLSVRDYIQKNNFPGVLVGVSGGIDSALTLTIAVDALGPDKVHGVIMPSRFTSDISMEDAKLLCDTLGVKHDVISIEPAYQSFLDTLAPVFQNKKPDITEENIQARCRAILLMALSNKTGKMVLTTGNRSELAVGYCTIYGDMAGGFGVLKDVPKTMVFDLSRYRNKMSPVIPQRTIDRPPTAELADNQKDQDSLPPYSLLDGILEAYIDNGQSIDEIIDLGFDKAVVTKVVKLIHRSEYKRSQAAIGPRIKQKSFGKDWRYPVTDGFMK